MNISRVLSVLVLLLLIGFPVLAHETRVVGEYAIEVGWRIEPTFTGYPNGPEFFISAEESGEPVEGAEETLQLEVIYGNQTMPLPLYADDPGYYYSNLIPSLPGDYTFRIVGTIGETEIDEAFTSADGEMSTVEAAGGITFPQLAGSEGDLKAQISDLQVYIAALEARIAALEE